MKLYDQKGGKLNDFFTTIDSEYLLKTLLNNSSKFATQVDLNEKSYKMKCKNVEKNIEFSIDFSRVDSETVCVDFKKQSGGAMEYYELVNSIKVMIEAI